MLIFAPVVTYLKTKIKNKDFNIHFRVQNVPYSWEKADLFVT